MDQETENLIRKYDRPVPRYTSYPTAVQFEENFSQEDYVQILAGLDKKEPVSLYLHIPFCHILCHYCGCHTQVVNSYKPMEAYLRTLYQEIEMIGKALSASVPVACIHFGGGSPNFLTPEDFKKLIAKLGSVFALSEATDIAMEMDPRLLTEEKIAGYVSGGVNRVSFGVQDFNPEVQEAVNRVQPFEKVAECTRAFRAGGMRSINFDMMYGLPLQTISSIEKSMDQAVSLEPDRFAVFAYAHVPWMKKHQKILEKYGFPEGLERFEMNEAIKRKLESAGYRAIGIDHFAREEDLLYQALKAGKLHRNFQGYTDEKCDTIIGMGVSSISSFARFYVQNVTGAAAYQKALAGGSLPVARGCRATQDDLARRAAIEQVMCNFEADFGAFPDVPEKLAALEKDGLIEIAGNRLKVTEKGRPFTRVVACAFDAYFKAVEGRHARAV